MKAKTEKKSILSDQVIVEEAARRSGTCVKNWVVSCRIDNAVCLCNETDNLDGYMGSVSDLQALRIIKGII